MKLKNKNARWQEKETVGKTTVQEELSEEGNRLLNELVSFVTENRYQNVVSKLGPVTVKDFGVLMQSLSRDSWEAFSRQFQGDFDRLDKAEQKFLKKCLNQACNDQITRQLALLR